MKTALFPPVTKDMPSKERIMELVRGGIYTLCFIGILIHLSECYRLFYQVSKDEQISIALIFFVLMLMVIQRVKLLNIPSLIVTVCFGILAFFGTRMYLFAPDLFPGRVLNGIVDLMVLLLITDMAITKRVRRLNSMYLWLFALICLMTVIMQAIHPGTEPRIYLLLALFALIPIKKKEHEIVLGGLLNAGLIVSVIAAFLSHVINPYTEIQKIWTGYLYKEAGAGIFCALLTVLALLSIIRAKEHYGRFGLCYLASCIWFGMTIVYAFLVGKINVFSGYIFLLLFLLVFGFRKTNTPRLILRGCIALSCVFIVGYITLDLINIVASTQFEPRALYDVINKTPLRFFPGIANRIVSRIIVFAGKRVSSYYLGNPVLSLINNIASGRIEQATEILKTCSFTYSTASYGRYSTSHTGYLEPIYNYGYLAGIMNVVFYVSCFITAIVRYVKEKKFEFLSAVALGALMFGIWLGEAEPATAPLMFVVLIVFVPCMWKDGNERKKQSKESE